MKLYQTHVAPNPRRVRIFLAEKGLLNQVELVEIDLQGGQNLDAAFTARNPMRKVPALELADGRCLSESMAICRYFEEQFPETPALLGHDAWEKGHIDQWLRWLDFHFMLPTGGCFQHGSGYFADRMTPIPAWADSCRQQVLQFLDFLEQHLAQQPYLCGNEFTAADISAFVTLDFNRVNQIRPEAQQHPNLIRWQQAVQSRPSATV